jgi:hypothetical protein
MESDLQALRAMAQDYFDAAYEMDADKFGALFHHASSVTRIGDDGEVNVTPVGAWLAAVRNQAAPKLQGRARHDEVLSIDVVRDLALVKLQLRIHSRIFTDLLSCLKVNGSWRIVQKVLTAEVSGV